MSQRNNYIDDSNFRAAIVNYPFGRVLRAIFVSSRTPETPKQVFPPRRVASRAPSVLPGRAIPNAGQRRIRDIKSKILVRRGENEWTSAFFFPPPPALPPPPRLVHAMEVRAYFTRAELFVIRNPFRTTRIHSTLMDTDHISQPTVLPFISPSAFRER